MEKCPQSRFPIKMVPLNAGWSDLGAWDAVWQVAHDALQDPQGNVAQGDTLMVDTTQTLIHATSRLVASVGVTNLIIVETPDAVLVMDRGGQLDIWLVTTLAHTYGTSEAAGARTRVLGAGHQPSLWVGSG